MKHVLSVGAVAVVALLPISGNAQVYQVRTPAPPSTAQYEPWQFNDETILVNGVVYYPTRESRFFDGEIMSQVATYRRVPVYADVTLEAHSVIYLPIGRGLMRGYERRREGELAGTTGSRLPAFPVDVASALTVEPRETQDSWPAPESAAGRPQPAPLVEMSVAANEPDNVPRSTTNLESIPKPRGNEGIWLEYAGARWYSDGPAVGFDADRFVQIGSYRGFAVYRDKDRGPEEIWVRTFIDGPLAPYARR